MKGKRKPRQRSKELKNISRLILPETIRPTLHPEIVKNKDAIIGISGSIISPIIRNKEFIVRVHNLPAYQQKQTPITSKENLASVHFSREDYKKAWKVAVQDFIIHEKK